MGADPNWKNSLKLTPLLWAASKGNTKVCKILVEKGCDLESTGEFSMNALDYSILYGNYKSATYLYSEGLRPSRSSSEFETIKEIKGQSWVNIEKIIESLENDVPVYVFSTEFRRFPPDSIPLEEIDISTVEYI